MNSSKKCNLSKNELNENKLYNITILSYNINGLENKLLYPSFFDFIRNSEIFILIETHLAEEKVEMAKKYFIGFDLYFEPARRTYRFGRAIGGCVCGVSKKLADIGISFEIKKEADMITMNFFTRSVSFTVIPLYLRPANWQTEFDILRESFDGFSFLNPIIIGDLNVRIGESNQEVVDVYRELFGAGLEVRMSKDKIINGKVVNFSIFALKIIC